MTGDYVLAVDEVGKHQRLGREGFECLSGCFLPIKFCAEADPGGSPPDRLWVKPHCLSSSSPHELATHPSPLFHSHPSIYLHVQLDTA